MTSRAVNPYYGARAERRVRQLVEPPCGVVEKRVIGNATKPNPLTVSID
jgi:hypothetical protein